MINHPLFGERFLQLSREVVPVRTGALQQVRPGYGQTQSTGPLTAIVSPRAFHKLFPPLPGPQEQSLRSPRVGGVNTTKGPGFGSLVLTDEEENEAVCHARLSIVGLSQRCGPCVPGWGRGEEVGAAERCQVLLLGECGLAFPCLCRRGLLLRLEPGHSYQVSCSGVSVTDIKGSTG